MERPIIPTQYTVYSIHCLVYTIYCIVLIYTIQCTLYSTLCSMHYKLCATFFANYAISIVPPMQMLTHIDICNMQSLACILQYIRTLLIYILYSMHKLVHAVQWTVYRARIHLHLTPYNVYCLFNLVYMIKCIHSLICDG